MYCQCNRQCLAVIDIISHLKWAIFRAMVRGWMPDMVRIDEGENCVGSSTRYVRWIQKSAVFNIEQSIMAHYKFTT